MREKPCDTGLSYLFNPISIYERFLTFDFWTGALSVKAVSRSAESIICPLPGETLSKREGKALLCLHNSDARPVNYWV